MSERRRLMVRYLKRLEELAPLGYTAGLHIRFAAPLYMRSTYPQSWQDTYAANAYSLRDPLVFWGISKTGKTRWSEIALPDPFGVLERAREHGLIYGMVASCGKITSRTIVGAARDDREFTDPEIDEIATIAGALHEVGAPPEDLSPPMIEALRLLGEGRERSAIAAEMGISEDALEAWLSSARHRLGAETTDEAIRMAKEFRLI